MKLAAVALVIFGENGIRAMANQDIASDRFAVIRHFCGGSYMENSSLG